MASWDITNHEQGWTKGDVQSKVRQTSISKVFLLSHRHVIWASSNAGKPTFPGLADAFANAESSKLPSDWQKVHYHLSVVSQAIEGAASMLADVI